MPPHLAGILAVHDYDNSRKTQDSFAIESPAAVA
jgi:hypothetical protein